MNRQSVSVSPPAVPLKSTDPMFNECIAPACPDRRTRRVLVIAFHYPPSLQSGALRPRGLVKYLGEYGWDTHVLTPHMEGERPGRVTETDYEDVVAKWKRRFWFNPHRALREQLSLPTAPSANSRSFWSEVVGAARWVITYPDPLKGWQKFAIDGLGEIAGQRWDAIVSTAPPLVCHMIARRARAILNCPWIADYRDLWNVKPDTLEDQTGLAGLIQKRTEARVLSTADALVTVSEPWAERLRQRYSEKPVYCITNGFDPDELCNEQRQLSPKFSIIHTGMLYRGRRDPSALLEVLRELIDEGQMDASDLLLQFYGRVDQFLLALLQRYGLDAQSELRASVPRPEILELQRRAQVLLILSWSGPHENGGHTGKVFEYLAASRPILAWGGARGVLTDLLSETKAGVHALSKEELRNFIVQAYFEYKRYGRVLYDGSLDTINRYSQKQMAQNFAQVLDSVTAECAARKAAAQNTVAA